jgi:ribosomal protein S18 acetylase RimI-like enzyme
MGAATLDAAGAAADLVERDGAAVGTGFSALAGDGLALFSISTVPAYRHQGLGRAVTEAIVRDGARDGATLAALQSSEAGFARYESMGFIAAENWTVLLPG